MPEVGVEVRKMKVTKEDINKFGYTAGCPGCASIKARKSPQWHNDKC